MKQKHFDVFISYRREGGFEMADSIYQRLKNAGYAVFFDLEQLNAGKFNTKLLAVIEQCQDFIIVLPPHALDRCNDKDDWVRQEVEYAMKLGKNIVPIMLRGFEWPEPETLPASLRDLQNYNAISASDHNVFSENIERLKKYFLRSKVGFRWQRYKMLIVSICAALVIVLAAIFTYMHFDYDKYEQVCIEQSQAMLSDFSIMHYNLSQASQALEAWNHYYMTYTPKQENILKEDLSNVLAFIKRHIKSDYNYKLSEKQKEILRSYGFPVEELEAFPIITASLHDEVIYYIDNFEVIMQDTPSDFLHKNIQYGYEFLKLSLQCDYYGMLSVISLMPPSVYDERFTSAITTFTLLSGISPKLSFEEYETLQQQALNQLEEIVQKMGGVTHDMERELEVMEGVTKRLEEEYLKAFVDKKIESIEDKKVAVEQRKVQLAELEQKKAELYENAMRKFALQPTDDQGTMWGKILRMALFAEEEMESDKQEKQGLKDLKIAAQNAGTSADHLDKRTRMITYHEMYKNVDLWLQQYEAFNPAKEAYIGQYVAAARAYFKAVEAGKQNPRIGTILVATKDNEQHPVLQIGDIMIEKNGKTISTVSDFFEKSDVTEHNVKVLRLVNNELTQLEFTYSANCPVLVGISPLSEDRE